MQERHRLNPLLERLMNRQNGGWKYLLSTPPGSAWYCDRIRGTGSQRAGLHMVFNSECTVCDMQGTMQEEAGSGDVGVSRATTVMDNCFRTCSFTPDSRSMFAGKAKTGEFVTSSMECGIDPSVLFFHRTCDSNALLSAHVRLHQEGHTVHASSAQQR